MFSKQAKLRSLLKAKLREAGLLKSVRSGKLDFKELGNSPMFRVPDSLKKVKGLTPDDLTSLKKHHHGRLAARNPDKGYLAAANELGEKGAISEAEMHKLISDHPHWSNIAKGLLAKGSKKTKTLGLTRSEILENPGAAAAGEVITRDMVKGLSRAFKGKEGLLKGKKINVNLRVSGEKPQLRVIK
jgi:hypothetical protein